MGWVTELRDQVVGLDTSPLIYYIEEHFSYIELLDKFFDSLRIGDFRAVTSTVTLLEVLVQPLRCGDEALAHRYNDILLSSPSITLCSVTHATAQDAAELRARHNLKTANAIQLATAIGAGALAFLTNDRGIPDNCGITILRLDDLVR